MLLTCPNCETVFRVASDSIGESGKSVRCSVCTHIWQAHLPMLTPEESPGEMGNAVRTILLPLFVLILLVGIGAGAGVEASGGAGAEGSNQAQQQPSATTFTRGSGTLQTAMATTMATAL